MQIYKQHCLKKDARVQSSTVSPVGLHFALSTVDHLSKIETYFESRTYHNTFRRPRSHAPKLIFGLDTQLSALVSRANFVSVIDRGLELPSISFADRVGACSYRSRGSLPRQRSRSLYRQENFFADCRCTTVPTKTPPRKGK